MFDDTLTICCVICVILIAIAPIIGIIALLILILKFIYKKVRLMNYRYSYFVWKENGTYRDSGDNPLNESMALMVENGLMQQGMTVTLRFNDTDYDKVQKVINETRENHINILNEPIDNRAKVV